MNRQRLAIGLVILALSGCGGGGGGSDLVLGPRDTSAETTLSPRTTTSTTSAVTPVTTAAGPTASWQQVTANLAGLTSECGTVPVVTAQPGTDLVIAGVARNGLWALTPDGTAWTQLGTGGGDEIPNRPTWIQWDPVDPATFWEAGIYVGPGVYGTTDGGSTFAQLGDITHIDTVSVDLTDPERRIMLAGQHEVPIVFRSVNGGTSWTDVSAGLPANAGHAFAPLVVDGQTHLLGTKGSPSAGVFRTTDGGVSWSQVHAGAMSSQPLVTADGAIYWVLETGGMIVSTDQGATWTEKLSQVGGSLGLLQLPDGRLAALANEQVVLSEDQGTTWVPIGAPMPYAPLGLTYSAGHQSFYIWRFDCAEGDVPVGADNIMALAFEDG